MVTTDLGGLFRLLHLSDRRMPIVKVVGWEAGLRKISLTKLMRETTANDLPRSKAMVDALLEGHSFDVNFDDAGAAKSFAARAKALGARVTTSGDW